jgi:energy-coupling factor transport system permease protein
VLNLPGLYLPGTSYLHRLHPLTKLVFSLACVGVIFGGPGGWLAALIPGLSALLLLGRAGLAGRAIHAVIRLLTPLVVVLFLMHGLFNPHNQTVMFQIGPFTVGQEGLAYASEVALRLAATLAASLVLVFTTHPTHLVQALEEAGLPHGLAYLLGSPLLLVPEIADRALAIRAAQQSRGLETQGSLLQRARALFPWVAPLVFSVLVELEERSLALEVRGFSAPNPKTSLNELVDTPSQRVGRWALVLLAVLLLIAGLWWRVNASD